MEASCNPPPVKRVGSSSLQIVSVSLLEVSVFSHLISFAFGVASFRTAEPVTTRPGEPPQACADRGPPSQYYFFFTDKEGFRWVASAEASARFCGAVWLYGTEDSTRAVLCRLSGVSTLETSSLQCWHLVGAQGQGPDLPLITADATHLPKRGGFGFFFYSRVRFTCKGS